MVIEEVRRGDAKACMLEERWKACALKLDRSESKK